MCGERWRARGGAAARFLLYSKLCELDDMMGRQSGCACVRACACLLVRGCF